MHIDVPNRLTRSEFARRIGVSPGRITQLIDRGLPFEVDDRIDLTAGLAWCRRNIDPLGRRADLRDRTEASDEAARRTVEGWERDVQAW